MTIWKVTKHYKGGSGTYQANMPKGWKMRRGHWEAQLSSWGTLTDGGHGYGWRIYAVNVRNPVKAIIRRWGYKNGKVVEVKPSVKSAKRLQFNMAHLERR